MEDKALKNIKEMNVMGLFSIFSLVLALLIAFTMSGFLDLVHFFQLHLFNTEKRNDSLRIVPLFYV